MLTDKDIEHIAKLARIKLSDEEIPVLRGKLSSVFDYIGKLNNVNTDEVTPIFQTTGIVDSVRHDSVADRDKLFSNSDSLLDQAPQIKDNFIKVPSVLGRSKK